MRATIQEIAKQLRETHNISPEEIAKRIGTYERDYLRWENGSLDIDFKFILAICRVYGVSLVEMLTYEGNDFYGKPWKG